jgi:hypothetical protein
VILEVEANMIGRSGWPLAAAIERASALLTSVSVRWCSA